MSGIKFKGISGYDFLLKKYAAGLITVSVSRNHPELVAALENILDVKSVVNIAIGQTSWNATAVRGIKDTGGYAYVVRVENEGEAIISYTDENGDAASTVVKTGNAFVCVSHGPTWAESKWLFVSDDEVVVTVENKGATFGWGQTVTVATVQGKNITLAAPADPAVGDVAQVTYDADNVLQTISGSTKKLLKLPQVYVKAVNDAQTGDNRGLYVKYWDAAGVEQYDTIANITDLQAVFGISDIQDDVNAIKSKIPAQASSSNQLADKTFVNSSIATATAKFMDSLNLYDDLELDPDTATHSDIGAKLDDYSFEDTPDNNDYCFVEWPQSTVLHEQITQVERYKFNGSNWAYEYTLNNSGMTAAQLAATLSGITAEKVGKIADKPASPSNGQLVKFDSNGNLDNSGIPATSVIQNVAVTGNPTIQKVKVMTSAEYYALTTLDANTEYIII